MNENINKDKDHENTCFPQTSNEKTLLHAIVGGFLAGVTATLTMLNLIKKD